MVASRPTLFFSARYAFEFAARIDNKSPLFGKYVISLIRRWTKIDNERKNWNGGTTRQVFRNTFYTRVVFVVVWETLDLNVSIKLIV